MSARIGDGGSGRPCLGQVTPNWDEVGGIGRGVEREIGKSGRGGLGWRDRNNLEIEALEIEPLTELLPLNH